MHLTVRRITVLTSLLVLLVWEDSQAQTTIYLAGNGNDRWSGSQPTHTPSGTDGPVRTFERVLEIIQTKALAERAPGVLVSIRGGTYVFDHPLHLDSALTGRGEHRITFRPYRHERVTIRGSVPVTNFRVARETGRPLRLSPELEDSILVSDLRALGITDFGEITAQGSPGLELFFRGKRMPLARWPNQGWVRIADVPQTGDSMFNTGLEREKRYDGVPAGRHYGRITYEGTRPNRWAGEDQLYLHGYWTFDWSDAYQRVAAIDTINHQFILAPPYHHYGYTKNQRYYAANVLEELDEPGEWYLDRQRGLLYFWPPAKMDSTAVRVSVLAQPFFELDGASKVRFEDMEITEGRAGAFVVRGGRGNAIMGCTIHNLGGDAVLFEGGRENGIEGCDLFDLALGAITLRGGDRSTLTPARHSAVNNHIHHFGQWIRTGKYACILDGVGNRFAQNEVHDAPFEAIYLKGNDQLVEYNNIHHVTQETGDAGALHTGRNWTWQGNIIRYNYFHDLRGPGLHGVMGVYLDDWASGFFVFGNIFYRAGRATLIGGGRYNTVENNIYVECAPSIHLDARGLGWASYYFDGTHTELFDEMEEMHYDQPPYSTRYPKLLQMEDSTPAVPKGNIIQRNVSWGGRWMDVYDFSAFDFSVVRVKGNVIADSALLRRWKPGQKGWDPYYLDIDMKKGYELLTQGSAEADSLFRGNTLIRVVPGSIDARTGRVKLSPAFTPSGFKPIPFDKIGLRRPSDRRVAR